jgi:hypothetical protein
MAKTKGNAKAKKTAAKFWEFRQNNSGGSFDFDKSAGITHFVFIEAPSMDEAIIRAEAIGLYWDGCDTGRDCPCCGDRWSTPWSDDADDEPKHYGTPIADYVKSKYFRGWMDDGYEACVHYLDGSKKWF